MIDAVAWAWPQFTLLAFLFIHLGLHAANSGKPYPHPSSFPMAFCRIALWLFLLTFGGFFA